MSKMTINLGLSAIFDYATEGILITDSDGSIVIVNPSINRMFGYEGEELIGKKVEFLIPNRFSDKHVGHRSKYIKDPHPRAMGKGMTLFAKRKNESEFPVEISLSSYQNGKDKFVIAFVIDVTDRKAQDDKIRKANEELEQRVKDRTLILNEALTQLERSKNELETSLAKEMELNELKSRFVSMASHEFRTPLSAILSSVSLISKYNSPEDDEKRQKHITRIKSSVSHLTEILNDFLSIGKLEEGKINVSYESFSILGMVNTVIEGMKGLLRPDQEIVYVKKGEGDTVTTDQQLLKNALINLVSNASKYSQPGKKITITSEVRSGELTLSVTDEGIGIPERDQQHLFERFFRASNVTNIEGTGLGLSIIRRYIELLKGEITYKSVLNQGTTFYITIPIK